MQDYSDRRKFLAASAWAVGLGSVESADADTPAGSASDLLNVRDFGAKGDGVSDDAAAIQAALDSAKGKTVLIPSSPAGFVISKTITVPNGSHLAGVSAHASRLLARGAGPAMVVGANSTIERIFLDGSGGAGDGLRILERNGQQNLLFLRITDFVGPCLYFDVQAGSGFNCIGCLMYRRDSLPGSQRYAIVVEDKPQLRAVPRKFVNLETGGQCSIALGGSNSTYIANSFLADIDYSPNTAAALITNSRIATKSIIEIRGGQNSITGCDIYPPIVLRERAGGCVIGPNSHNTRAVSDQSGNSTNAVYFAEIRQVAELKVQSADGPDIVLAADLRWSRQGTTVHARLVSNVNDVLNFQASNLRLPLPQPSSQLIEQPCGSVSIRHSGGLRRLQLVCPPKSEVALIEAPPLIPGSATALQRVTQLIAHYLYMV